MLGFLLRTGLKMLALAGLLYLIFFVELGDHTLYGHLSRIAGTREARELTDAVAGSALQLFDAARQQLQGLGSTATN